MITLSKENIMELAREKGFDLAEIALECEKQGATQRVREALVAGLYYSGVITSKQACKMLGVLRRDFEGEILGRYGFASYGNDEEDIRREIDGINALKNYCAK